MDIVIVGAGIGGLTAAASLLQRGHRVRVVEQSQALGEIGAGLQLSANAVKVLFSLGLKEALDVDGVKPTALECRRFDSGELLFRVPQAKAHLAQYGADFYQIHRADLHAALARKVLTLDPKALHLGARVTGIQEDKSSVTLGFANSDPMRAELVIGADGIKSIVREHVHGAEDKPTFTGQVAWRLLIPIERIPRELRTDLLGTMWCGYGKYALMYYLRGGKLLNFVGSSASDWNEESWTARRPWQELDRDYAGWHPIVRAVIDAADRDQCFCWALNSRTPDPIWSTDRLTMLGDAVHAMLPNMAQGAAMAIEDAAVLARALDLDLPLAEALRCYEQHRAPRTSRVVEASAVATTFFQFKSETTDEMRQYFQDNKYASREWLYSYDALGVDLVSTLT
jgi:salicylate hydroxylase